MRMIDTDNVLKALGVFNDREHGDPHFLNGIETAREIVEQAPTIDAVPVVRCEMCKHWTACESEENDCNCYGVCKQINRLTIWDWFCADGEVK